MGADIWGGILVVLVGAPLLKLLDVWFGRRKSSAETESINVKTATELNGSLMKQIGALEATVSTLRRDVASLERRERARNRREAKHEAWDYQAVAKLREAGIDLPDPPPLGDGDDATERTRAEDFGLPGTRPEGDRRSGSELGVAG